MATGTIKKQLTSNKQLTFNDYWYHVFHISGRGLVTYFPMPTGAINAVVGLSNAKMYLSDGWHDIVVNSYEIYSGQLNILFDTPTSLDMSAYEGKVLLLSVTGNITFS